MINDIMYLLAKRWVEFFLKKPLHTSIVTFIFAAAFTTAALYITEADRKAQESKRLENNNYQAQLKQLSETEKNIQQLLTFVKTQQITLRETEDSIAKLRSEKEKLQPLVELDRAAIETIFRSQEERANASVWRERFIGFAIGIVASLIASFIWSITTILIKRKSTTA
jgi:DNA repair exonuclease SbcCD ATPase subunit